jgi:predicted TIM-barrel fold metal-dependent hydrolase
MRPIVDCHAHVFTRDLPLVGDAWNAPAYDYTPQDYLAELDRPASISACCRA